MSDPRRDELVRLAEEDQQERFDPRKAELRWYAGIDDEQLVPSDMAGAEPRFTPEETPQPEAPEGYRLQPTREGYVSDLEPDEPMDFTPPRETPEPAPEPAPDAADATVGGGAPAKTSRIPSMAAAYVRRGVSLERALEAHTTEWDGNPLVLEDDDEVLAFAQSYATESLLRDAVRVVHGTGDEESLHEAERRLGNLPGDTRDDLLELAEQWVSQEEARHTSEDQQQAIQFWADRIEPGTLNNIATGLMASLHDINSLIGRVREPDLADEYIRQSNLMEMGAHQADQENWFGRHVRGATRSVATSSMGGLVAGPYGAIGSAMILEGNRAYTDGKDAGLEGGALASYVTTAATIEGGVASTFQRVGLGGMEKLFGGAGLTRAGVLGILKQTGLAIAEEIPEEVLTEIAHNANQVLHGVDPKALSPEQLTQTVSDTIMQTLLATGAVSVSTGMAMQGPLMMSESQRIDQVRAMAATAGLSKEATRSIEAFIRKVAPTQGDWKTEVAPIVSAAIETARQAEQGPPANTVSTTPGAAMAPQIVPIPRPAEPGARDARRQAETAAETPQEPTVEPDRPTDPSPEPWATKPPTAVDEALVDLGERMESEVTISDLQQDMGMAAKPERRQVGDFMIQPVGEDQWATMGKDAEGRWQRSLGADQDFASESEAEQWAREHSKQTTPATKDPSEMVIAPNRKAGEAIADAVQADRKTREDQRSTEPTEPPPGPVDSSPDAVAEAFERDQKATHADSWNDETIERQSKSMRTLVETLTADPWTGRGALGRPQRVEPLLAYLQEHGILQVARDRTGHPYYAMGEAEVPAWLSKSDKDADLQALPARPDAPDPTTTRASQITAAIQAIHASGFESARQVQPTTDEQKAAAALIEDLGLIPVLIEGAAEWDGVTLGDVIAINTEVTPDRMRFVIGHEVAHAAELDVSLAPFADSEAVTNAEMRYRRRYEAMIEAMRSMGQKDEAAHLADRLADADWLRREAIADMVGEALGDPAVYARLFHGERTLIDRLVQAIRQVIQRLRGMETPFADRVADAMIERMESHQQRAEQQASAREKAQKAKKSPDQEKEAKRIKRARAIKAGKKKAALQRDLESEFSSRYGQSMTAVLDEAGGAIEGEDQYGFDGLPTSFTGQLPTELKEALQGRQFYMMRLLKVVKDGSRRTEGEDALRSLGTSEYVRRLRIMSQGEKGAIRRAMEIMEEDAQKGTYYWGEEETDLLAKIRMWQALDEFGEEALDWTDQDLLNWSPAPREDSERFRQWFGDSKVVDFNGNPLRVYHGTMRADRFGSIIHPRRASSGPMPFWTESATIASNYAGSKRDTSLDLDGPTEYAEWFRLTIGGMEYDLTAAWRQLPARQRIQLRDTLPHVTDVDPNGNEMDGYRLGREDEYGLTSKDHWAHVIREHRGNVLRAAVDIWLDSGRLLNYEHEFLEILQTAGLDGVVLDDPTANHAGVIDAYLAIENPLDTGEIPPEVIEALQDRADSIPVPTGGFGVDPWDKRLRNPIEWVRELEQSVADGDNLVWTSIPDWVTDTLSEMGYDGILDTGGKLGGPEHRVWIPFAAGQIKSPRNQGAWNPASNDMQFSPTDDGRFWLEASVAEFGLTTDPAEAGYILPDGTMLDFSEKAEGGRAGMRSMDHRQVTGPIDDLPGGTLGMQLFMANTGAMRVDLAGDTANVHFVRPPNREQIRALESVVRMGGELVIDATEIASGYVTGSRVVEIEDARDVVAEIRSAVRGWQQSVQSREMQWHEMDIESRAREAVEERGLRRGDEGFDEAVEAISAMFPRDLVEGEPMFSPGIPIRGRRTRHGNWTTFSASAREPGMIQATYWDDTGPFGHGTYPSMVQAMQDHIHEIPLRMLQETPDAFEAALYTSAILDADSDGREYAYAAAEGVEVERQGDERVYMTPDGVAVVYRREPLSIAESARRGLRPATMEAVDVILAEYAERTGWGPEAMFSPFDLFGEEYTDRLTGAQRGFGLDPGRDDRRRTVGETEIKPELVQAAYDAMKKRNFQLVGGKDVYLALKEDLKGEADELFMNPANAIPEADEAYRRAGKGGALFGRPQNREPDGPTGGMLFSPQERKRQWRPVEGFHSKARRVIETKMPERQSGRALRGLLKKAGVKAEEMVWWGIDDYLEQKAGAPAEKTELLAYMDSMAVSVVESTVSETMIEAAREARIRAEHTWREAARAARREATGNIEGALLGRNLIDAFRGDEELKGRLQDALPEDVFNRLEAADAARTRALDHMRSLKLRYERHRQPGGGNYTERLWQLTGTRPELNRLMSQAELSPEAEARQDALFAAVHPGYESAHWRPKNILAHARTTDRVTPTGERVLMIEEIQSDWHQAGRKEGYRDSEMVRQLQTAKQAYLEAVDRAEDMGIMPTEFDGQFFTGYRDLRTGEDFGDGEGFDARVEAIAAINRTHASVREIEGRMQSRVPDAPWKNTWVDLAAKRLVRAAAEGDYDAIAWTTGAQQASLYNLDKVVETIGVRHVADGGREVEIEVKDGEVGDDIDLSVTPEGTIATATRTDIEGRTLGDLVGKEMAERIMAANDGDVLAGDDLRLREATGMRVFYDRIVKKVMAKLAKRLGTGLEMREMQPGATFTVEALQEISSDVTMPYWLNPDFGEWAVVRRAGGMRPEIVDATSSREEADTIRRELLSQEPTGDGMGPVHFMAMPETVRETVRRETMPWFSPKAPQNQAFKRWFGDSQVRDTAGRPKVMYHGTPTPGFEAFDPTKLRDGMVGRGIYTTSDTELTEGVLPLYLRIQRPLDFTDADGVARFLDEVRDLLDGPVGRHVHGIMEADYGDQWRSFQEDALDRMERGETVSERSMLSHGRIVNPLARRLGYDGIKHTGGLMRGGRRHDVWIAFEPHQVKSAIGNRGTYDADAANMLWSPAPEGFYLKSVRAIEAMEIGKKGIDPKRLRNLLEKQGVSDEEMYWSGLDEVLETDGRWSREDLLRHVTASMPTIEEVHAKPRIDEFEVDWHAPEAVEPDWDHLRQEGREVHWEQAVEEIADREGYALEEFPEEEYEPEIEARAAEIAHRAYLEHPDWEMETSEYDAFIRWSDEGDSYHVEIDGEFVPGEFTTLDEAQDAAEKALWGRHAGSPQPATRYHEDYRLETESLEWANYQELLLVAPDLPEGHSNDHWDDDRVIAHMRVQDVSFDDGDAGLLVEEIQSDWHQAGREKGYRGDPPTVVSVEHEPSVTWRVMFGDQYMGAVGYVDGEAEAIAEARERLMGEPEGDGEWTAEKIVDDDWWKATFSDGTAELVHAKRESEAMARAQRLPYGGGGTGVAKAPLTGDRWWQHALRRLLRRAARGDYTHLAILPAVEQVRRYESDVRAAVDRILVHPDPDRDGSYVVQGDQGDQRVIERRATDEGELAGLVGKRMAKDALGQIEANGQAVIEGDGLTIGGQGMHVFYDQKIPNWLKKEARKNHWNTSIEQKTLTVEGREVKLHALAITPELAAHADAGMPLFSPQQYDRLREQIGRWSEDETATPTTRRGVRSLSKRLKRGWTTLRRFVLGTMQLEPAKLVEETHGPEVYADVMEAIHQPEAAMLEYQQTQLESAGMPIQALEDELAKYSDTDLRNLALARGNPDSLPAVSIQRQALEALPGGLRNLLPAIQEMADLNYRALKRLAPDTGYVEEYFYGVYERDPAAEADPPTLKDFWFTTDRFMKEKKFPTAADAAAHGYRLRDVSPATNIKREMLHILRLAAMRQLRNRLVRDAYGSAIIEADEVRHGPIESHPGWRQPGANSQGKGGEAAFDGLLVEPDLATLIENMVAANKISRQPVLRGFRTFLYAVQSIKFLGSMYHLMTEVKQSLVDSDGPLGFLRRENWGTLTETGLKENDPRTRTPEYLEYISLGGGHGYSLEAQAQGLMRRALLNPSARATWKALRTPLATVARFTNWMFERYIPALKYEHYRRHVRRNEEKLGRALTRNEKLLVIKEGQNFYGEMNERLFGRSGTATSVLRLLFLAPGFGEGNYRTLAKALLQWRKGGPTGAPLRSKWNIPNSLLFTLITANVASAILTGEWPEPPENLDEMRDLFKARTGMVDTRGKEILFDLLTFDRDYYEQLVAPALKATWGRKPIEAGGDFVGNLKRRSAGMLNIAWPLAVHGARFAQGQVLVDWKGDPLYYETDRWDRKVQAVIVNVADELYPISVSTMRAMTKYRGIDWPTAVVLGTIGLRASYRERDRAIHKLWRDMHEMREKQSDVYRRLAYAEYPRTVIEQYNRDVERVLSSDYITDEMREHLADRPLTIDVDRLLRTKRSQYLRTLDPDRREQIRSYLAGFGLRPGEGEFVFEQLSATTPEDLRLGYRELFLARADAELAGKEFDRAADRRGRQYLRKQLNKMRQSGALVDEHGRPANPATVMKRARSSVRAKFSRLINKARRRGDREAVRKWMRARQAVR